MKIDLTIRITPELAERAQSNLKKASYGHLGTHFDVMNKMFPLEYTERVGVVFDISKIEGRDVEISDIDLDAVKEDMMVLFYSGYVESEGYGTKKYFTEHAALSHELIDALLEKHISMIGVDFSGVRNGAEHNVMDQYCADRGVFIVENLCNMKALAEHKGTCAMHVYPLNQAGLTGLPCRVVADI